MDESFFVGGRYVEIDGGLRMTDQMYVQYREPFEPKHPYPIVFITGAGSSGAEVEMCIEGRPSWANLYVNQGFGVYVTDQVARGRSVFHEAIHGPFVDKNSATSYADRSARQEEVGLWTQAHLHTQWPGTGQVGDPAYDQIYAAFCGEMGTVPQRELLNRASLAALLDKIGPAIIMTNSQGGPLGWHIADARPDLVKAVVAIEPAGPPYFHLNQVGPPEYLEYSDWLEHPCGITMAPLTYDPPLEDGVVALPYVKTNAPVDDKSLADIYLQPEPARQLVNLAQTPILLVSGEASHHAGYDYGTVAFLRQGGVDVTHLPLVDVGIRGNGHGMIVEKNNAEIAQQIIEWIEKVPDQL